jgi:hypothetical protein
VSMVSSPADLSWRVSREQRVRWSDVRPPRRVIALLV